MLICTASFSQQFGRPISEITALAITGSYTDINETAINTFPYVYSADKTAAEFEVLLTTLTDPGIDTGFTVRANLSKSDGGVANSGTGNTVTVTVRLMQGATEIEVVDTGIVATWRSVTVVLTPANVANITDFSDLRLEFSCPSSGGSGANARGMAIAWAELEVPDGAPPSTRRRAMIINKK